MSVPVTIDSDDLEKLLFAVGAIKNVESAMRRHAEDPFLPDKDSITHAHDVIAKEWRRAKLAIKRPELSSREFENLKKVGEGQMIEHRDALTLRGLGVLEMGQPYHVTKWSSSGDVDSRPLAGQTWRLTEMGKRALELPNVVLLKSRTHDAPLPEGLSYLGK